jgi:hypothetical protein
LFLFFKKERLFFFEKKNQKTFDSLGWCSHGAAAHYQPVDGEERAGHYRAVHPA